MADNMPVQGYKLTDETVRKLETAFALGCTVKDACIFGGISRDSYYRWIREDPSLSDRFEQLQMEPILKARKTIIDNLDNPRTAAWYLERRLRLEFGRDVDTTAVPLDPYEKRRQLQEQIALAFCDEDGMVTVVRDSVETVAREKVRAAESEQKQD